MDWTRQAIRVLDIVTEQTRALRRRALMQDFQQTQEEGRTAAATPGRKGTYWSIKTRINAFNVSGALTEDSEVTEALRNIRTRLNEFSPTEQGHLINWAYALTDAATRKWVDPDNPAVAAWPVPEFALKG